MPISRNECLEGRAIESLERAILAHLAANRQQAFTAEEIYQALYRPEVYDPYNPATQAEIARIERIMDTILGKGNAFARAVGTAEEIYYTST